MFLTLFAAIFGYGFWTVRRNADSERSLVTVFLVSVPVLYYAASIGTLYPHSIRC